MTKKNKASDTPDANAQGGEQAAATEGGSGKELRLAVERQYVKSVSSSCLSGVDRATRRPEKPEIKVGVEVGAVKLPLPDDAPDGAERVEVLLSLKATAEDPKSGEAPLMTAEVTYAGVFALLNAEDRHRAVILGVEAPRMLFPFARAIIADLTRDTGYPPILLDNIDFASVLRQRIAQAQAQAKKDGNGSDDSGKIVGDQLKFD